MEEVEEVVRIGSHVFPGGGHHHDGGDEEVAVGERREMDGFHGLRGLMDSGAGALELLPPPSR